MKTAFAYARVSTKEQAIKDNSIPEQFRRIERYAQENKIKIINTYSDSESAYHDERQQFKIMISDAVELKPDFIIMDDSSRFARTRQGAIETKMLLRKNGVNVRFVSEPYVDPNTVAGLWLEGIQEIKNEATSLEISFHVIKGMTHNLQARDSQTGWCYKNGGKAPYGYMTKYVQRGQDSSGKQIFKSYWDIDPETSPIIREIIVDMFTKKQMSYRQIRNELNNRGIKSPKGNYWCEGTIATMLREHRLETYSGTAIWNKAVKRNNNALYKSRDKWVIQENAHPAIITKEEFKAAIERKKINRKLAPSGATRKSNYLLTGTNFERSPIFTCGKCGANVIGYGNSSQKWKKYICGAHRTKGKIACTNDWKVDQQWLEQRIVSEIEKQYTTPDKIDEIAKNIISSVSKNNRDLDKSLSNLESQLKKCDLEIKRLLDAIKSGIDPSLITEEVNNLKEKKEDLGAKISNVKKSYRNQGKIDVETLKCFFANFGQAYKNANVREKRGLIRTFVRHIELKPEAEEIQVEFYPNNIVQSISVGVPKLRIYECIMMLRNSPEQFHVLFRAC